MFDVLVFKTGYLEYRFNDNYSQDDVGTVFWSLRCIRPTTRIIWSKAFTTSITL